MRGGPPTGRILSYAGDKAKGERSTHSNEKRKGRGRPEPMMELEYKRTDVGIDEIELEKPANGRGNLRHLLHDAADEAAS